jgi:hypothetical protein
MHDMLGAFYKARGIRYSERFAELTTRFFSRLVEISAAYSREMADAVMPGMPSPPALPSLDPSESNAWFRQISEYSHSLSEHISSSYKSFLDRVASGKIDSENVKNVASRYLERRFPDYLRQLGMIYFELLSELNDLRAEIGNDYGPSGSVARATLSIDNMREQPATIRCHVGDLRRADGVGRAFPARVSVTPDALQLAPAQEGRVMLAVDLDATVFAPDELYQGTLRIVGHGEAPVDVALRVLATGGDAESDRQTIA